MLDLTAAFATFPVLETERFTLRAVTEADAAAMFRIMADPRVTRYFGSAPMASLGEAEERIASIRWAFDDHEGIRWAIAPRDSGQLIGTCGFWRLIKPHFRAELGYELDPDWWGQGVMTEVGRAVLRFGFTTIGLHSVEAHIHPDNTGSRRVLEKLGFVQEGYFRENFYEAADGHFTDTAIFSLLQATWATQTVRRG